MFAPKLYRVNKIPFKYILNSEFNVSVGREENNIFTVLQQDNMLFRQIRLITNDKTGMYIPWVIFVNCSGGRSNEEGLSELITNGFYFNNRRYVISERSASMVRQSILSFIDERLAEPLNEAVTMGISIGETVLSKWYAYCGLMLSSCHCLEGWKPKIVVMPDRMGIIKDQHIKYVVDTETPFVDKEGKQRIWKQKDIAEGVRDIEINLFDGCGIHHPAITDEIMERLSELGDMERSGRATSILLRAPFIKGMSHEVDYEAFFQERGVEFIKDIWGVWHDVRVGSTPMIIVTESMYKGYKYFKQSDNKQDWERYWDAFDKYNHCIGIVKWAYSLEEEEVYRRANYQILQDLDLDYYHFKQLATYSIEWVEKIIERDWNTTAAFIGLFADRCNPVTPYARAIAKNPDMLNEAGVRNYLMQTLKKHLNEMKCGKIFIKATSRYLTPDLIMMMEHIGGLELEGCLEADQFWTQNLSNSYISGEEYLLERNPHLCKSEHVILTQTTNETIRKYLLHLSNICMVNCKSLVAQRMNGADHDGDGILVVDNDIMKSGVDRNAAIVIDIEDKATALAEEDTPENKLQVILRGMHSLIGETSNCATTYHNKMPQTIKQMKLYEKYVDLLSVINGKAIDMAKTGVMFSIPRYIAKYSKPLPYFMKYAGAYYARQKKFLKSKSNMNRLCWDIEKWHNGIKWPRRDKNFDYRIMLDESVGIDEDTLVMIELVYHEYNKEFKQCKKDELSINRQYGSFAYNWDEFYDKYRAKCYAICPDIALLANIVVTICYEKYPSKTKGFMWNMAGDAIVDNITQADALFPIRDERKGCFEYLGKRYSLVKPIQATLKNGEVDVVQNNFEEDSY